MSSNCGSKSIHFARSQLVVSAKCQNKGCSAKPRASTDEKLNEFELSSNSELAKPSWKVVAVKSFSLGQPKHFIKQ